MQDRCRADEPDAIAKMPAHSAKWTLAELPKHSFRGDDGAEVKRRYGPNLKSMPALTSWTFNFAFEATVPSAGVVKFGVFEPKPR
jgi:hypothetical protein